MHRAKTLGSPQTSSSLPKSDTSEQHCSTNGEMQPTLFLLNNSMANGAVASARGLPYSTFMPAGA